MEKKRRLTIKEDSSTRLTNSGSAQQEGVSAAGGQNQAKKLTQKTKSIMKSKPLVTPHDPKYPPLHNY
jgi:predicted Rossmann fold nucleotide-binding protein DprA/Smf involved in DNA uptake